MIFKISEHAYNNCWTVGFTDSELWSINTTLSEKRESFYWSLNWNLSKPCSPEKRFDWNIF